MKSLVTGASGFIGRHLVKRLSEKGVKTRAFIRRTSNIQSLKDLKNVEICFGDITDYSSIEKAAVGCQIVYHIAALVNDWGDYQSFHRVNYLGTRNVIRASIKAEIKRFIYTSTIDVLDMDGKKVVQDDHPYSHSLGPYSKSKAEAEILVRKSNQKIPSVIIRPPAVYGPEDPQCTMRTLKLAERNLVFLVNRGKNIFPHLYIDNLIDVLILASQKNSAKSEIFNITDGVQTTAREFFNHLNRIVNGREIRLSVPYSLAWGLTFLMETFAKLTGIPPLISWTALKFLSLKCQFDISKARDMLGYNPRFSLEEGMKRVGTWWNSIS